MEENFNSENFFDKINQGPFILLIFILFGFIFVCSGFFVYKQDLKLKDICTEEVNAVCIDFATSYKTVKTNGYKEKRITYTPIFKYTYNNEEFVSHSDTYSSSLNTKFSINSEYTIFINPDNPNEFFNKNISGETKILGYILMFVGGMSVIIPFFALISELKNKNNFNKNK